MSSRRPYRDWWAQEVHDPRPSSQIPTNHMSHLHFGLGKHLVQKHGVELTRQLNLVALVMLHHIEHGREPVEPDEGWGRPYRDPHPHPPTERRSTPEQLRRLEAHKVRRRG